MEFPQLKIISLSKEKLKFELSNCDVSLANTLRRIIIAEVPTIAIHMVQIYENSSALADEVIAHRLGLIPLVSEGVEKFQYPWEENPDKEKKVTLYLQVKNRGEEVLTVTSKHIFVKNNQGHQDSLEVEDEEEHFLTGHPVKMYSPLPPYKEIGIPIVKLKAQQELNIEMDAEMGIGKMHAKWIPTSIAAFKFVPIVKLHPDIQKQTPQILKKFVSICPRKVFDFNEKNQTVKVQNSKKCNFCGECERFVAEQLPNPYKEKENMTLFTTQALYNEELVKISQETDKFIFKIETSGTLKPAHILKKALQVLKQKIKDINTAIILQEN